MYLKAPYEVLHDRCYVNVQKSVLDVNFR